MKIGDIVQYVGAQRQGLLEGDLGLIKGIEDGEKRFYVSFDTGKPAFQVKADEIKIYEHQSTSETGAKREKLNIPPYDLVPFQEITDGFVRVAEFGAIKYEPWNWSKGLSRVQLIGSLLRHTFAYLRGQERDDDSGLLHTDHILWNAVALTHNVHHDLEDGRRPEPIRDYHK